MSLTFDLDAPCGRHFTYRNLIECGKTWTAFAQAGNPLDNLPRTPATLRALASLCIGVLDPLTDTLGRPVLTYGFASPNLSGKIASRIAPKLDQHAAHEHGRSGRPVCARLGAAVDLVIPGKPAGEVARWIFQNTRFDRIYFYGDDRPLHVSVGPEERRAVVELIEGVAGRRTPRILRW